VKYPIFALLLAGGCRPAEDTEVTLDAPRVSLTIDPPALVEDPPSTSVFRLTLDQDPPPGGVRVYALGDVPQSLTQADLFNLAWTPPDGDGPVGDLTFSGFTLLMLGREATVSLLGYPDGQPEAPVLVTWNIVPFDQVPWGDAAVDGEPAAGPYAAGGPSATLELRDAP
jgi:hypothetical protein